jgi:single-strand DNA-binding protein
MTNLTITGNVGSIELKFTSAGKAVVSISVADTRRRFNKDTNAWEDAGTDWHRVTAWEKKAELYAETINKGDRVVVVGDLVSREYETTSGGKRTAWDIKADTIGIVPKAKSSGGYDRHDTRNQATSSYGQADQWATAEVSSNGTAPF